MCDEIIKIGLFPGNAYKQVRMVFSPIGVSPCLTTAHQSGCVDVRILEVWYV